MAFQLPVSLFSFVISKLFVKFTFSFSYIIFLKSEKMFPLWEITHIGRGVPSIPFLFLELNGLILQILEVTEKDDWNIEKIRQTGTNTAIETLKIIRQTVKLKPIHTYSMIGDCHGSQCQNTSCFEMLVWPKFYKNIAVIFCVYKLKKNICESFKI